MRPQYKLAAGLLGILMSLVSPVSSANLLSEDSAVKSEYMEAQRDSEVYALVGEHVIPVGEVKRGQLIRVPGGCGILRIQIPARHRLYR